MSDVWFGKAEQATFDLRAVASDANGAECHVCEIPAMHLVELSHGGEHAVELGSAVFLCQMCFDLVSSHDTEALSARFTEVSELEAVPLAERMILGNVDSLPVIH